MLNITIAKGTKSVLEAAAKADNESVNGYVKKPYRQNMKLIQARR